MSKKPYVLCIMDGFGKNPSQHGNAIAMAKKPNLDKLMAECPYTYIGASGMVWACRMAKWATARWATPIWARSRGVPGFDPHFQGVCRRRGL